MSHSLSRSWIAQEIAHTFQLWLVSLRVQLATEAIHHLADWQHNKNARPRLPLHLWQVAHRGNVPLLPTDANAADSTGARFLRLADRDAADPAA